MKKYLQYRKKIRCLVINSGILFNTFKSEIDFKSDFSFYNNTFQFQELNQFIELDDFDLILFDHTGVEFTNEQILHLINKLGKFNNVKTLLSFYESIFKKIPLIHLTNDWLLNESILHDEIKGKNHLFFKRVFDIFFVLITLPLTLPLFSMGVIMNLFFSKGPVLFNQTRVGANEKDFKLYKIRTMNVDKSNNNFTVHNDDRITIIGKFLRKSKIDELPQLYNILIGDMSLIGPRPERVDYVNDYNCINPYYHLRHRIKPGITGWAQVNNPKATPEENLLKLEYDLYYIKNMSLKLDIIVLFRTIKVVLTLNSL